MAFETDIKGLIGKPNVNKVVAPFLKQKTMFQPWAQILILFDTKIESCMSNRMFNWMCLHVLRKSACLFTLQVRPLP